MGGTYLDNHGIAVAFLEEANEENRRLREALERIAEMSPARANAWDATDLYHTVRAIARTALDTTE